MNGQYFGYVDATRHLGHSAQWSYTVRVFNLATGEEVYSENAREAEDGEPRDEVTRLISAFAMTENGESAWIVARDYGPELWARDASGAVSKLDDGIYANELESEGGTIRGARKAARSRPYSGSPSVTPGKSLELGPEDGGGTRSRASGSATTSS